MAQLTIYLPEPVEKRLRVRARRAKKSLSAYVVELIEERSGETTNNGWPPEFLALFGSVDASFPDEIEDLPPDPVPELDP